MGFQQRHILAEQEGHTNMPEVQQGCMRERKSTEPMPCEQIAPVQFVFGSSHGHAMHKSEQASEELTPRQGSRVHPDSCKIEGIAAHSRYS